MICLKLVEAISTPAPTRSRAPITASQNAWNSIDIRDRPPLAVRAKAMCSVISPCATARDTVHCTHIAAIMAPSIWPGLIATRARYIDRKCASETMKARDDRQRQDLVGDGDVGEGDDRHPDQVEDRDDHAEAFGAEPVQPAQTRIRASGRGVSRLAPGRKRRQCFLTIWKPP